MKYVNVAECKAAGLSPAKVEALANKLSECGREAHRLGLTIFGMGEGRLQERKGERPLIVASLDGPFDGGRGEPEYDEDGLRRAE